MTTTFLGPIMAISAGAQEQSQIIQAHPMESCYTRTYDQDIPFISSNTESGCMVMAPTTHLGSPVSSIRYRKKHGMSHNSRGNS